MVNFKILSGKQAGTSWSARRFPFWVGRAAASDLRLDEPGMWEKHFEVSLEHPDGFLLRAGPNASVLIGGSATNEAFLKNGDVIEAGAVKLRFSLTPTRQKALTAREICTWVGLGALCLAQIALVYWLSR